MNTKYKTSIGLVAFGTFLLGLSFGAIGGGMLNEYLTQPSTIYERKIEGDSKKYLTLELNNTYKIPFVETEKGIYKRLDEVSQTETSAKEKQLTSRLQE